MFGGTKFDYAQLITHDYLCFSKQWSTLKVKSILLPILRALIFWDFNRLKTRFDAVRKTYCPNFSVAGSHRETIGDLPPEAIPVRELDFGRFGQPVSCPST